MDIFEFTGKLKSAELTAFPFNVMEMPDRFIVPLSRVIFNLSSFGKYCFTTTVFASMENIALESPINGIVTTMFSLSI